MRKQFNRGLRSASILAFALILLATAVPALAQPVMVDVAASDATTVVVTFNEAVDATSAGTLTNYLVFQTDNLANRLTVSSAGVSGAEVTLGLASAMSNGVDYTIRSQNIQTDGGGAASGVQSLALLFDDGTTPDVATIASVQTNAATLEGQTVTIEGVVYIPSTFLQPGSSNWSAYIQDASGRGVNVFGFSDETIAASTALQTVGNRVRVTGVVTFYFTTVEIAEISEITLLESGASVPAPQMLTTSAANSSSWEGTYVEVTGQVTDSVRGGPGTNYTVDDGSGSVVVRVLDSIGAPSATVGETITARGAGAQFQEDYQVTVGLAADFEAEGGGGGGGDAVSIAEIHQNIGTYEGQTVTVEGIVYIPSDYLQPASANWSGYVQGDSGRGVNFFGFSDNTAAANPALQQTGNRVQITGVVTLYFTTVEIADITDVTLIQAGSTRPAPRMLTTGAANDSQWEGTFIEVTGNVTDSSVGGPGTNYTVDDGSGSIVVRVLNSVGAPTASVGSTITARGAGAQFQDDYQVTVGLAADFDADGGGGGGGGDTVSIADIHASLGTYEGQTVTVEGVVFIPSDHLQTAPGSGNWSGYVQGDSGRGVNFFGFNDNPAAANAALQQVGNRVQITGVVTLYFTTVEIADISAVTLIQASTTPPPAQPLSTADANSSEWEGTYIQVTGTVQSSSVGGPGTNYVVDDGSGSIVVRYLDAVAAQSGAFVPSTGDLITARGAGSQFQDTFQITLGYAPDIFLGADDEDRSPPRVLAAFRSGSGEITVSFDEALDNSSATNLANYELLDDQDFEATIVNATLIDPQTVLLVLAADIDVDSGYTLTVRNVMDLAGNALGSVSTAVTNPPTDAVGLDGPARTFLPRLGEQYPVTITLPATYFQGQALAAEVQLRVFDLQGRLITSLFDSRFDGASDFLNDSQATLLWDGRNDYSELVPAGAYVVHLLIVDERNGKTKELQLPVVVAARMDG